MDFSSTSYLLDTVTPTTYDQQFHCHLAQQRADWELEYAHLNPEEGQAQSLFEQQTLGPFGGPETPSPSFSCNFYPVAQNAQSATSLSSAVLAKRCRSDSSHCQMRDHSDSNCQSLAASSRMPLNRSQDRPYHTADANFNGPCSNFSNWINGPQPFSMCIPASECTPIVQQNNLSKQIIQTQDIQVYDSGEFCHRKAAESPFLAQYGTPSMINSDDFASMPHQLTPSLTATSSLSRSSGMMVDDETSASSVSMSRQSSLAGSSFCGALDMFRFGSSASDVVSNSEKALNILSHATDQPVATPSNPILPCSIPIDRLHHISHAGGVGINTPLFSKHDHPMSPSIIIDEPQWDMQRSTSTQSTVPSSSRVRRRNREDATGRSRPIAPKADVSAPISKQSSSSSGPPRMRKWSSDGSFKDFVSISKTKYVRPKPVKVMCDKCNKEPNGFRGAAELVRHQKTAHSPRHKVWVCVQAPNDAPYGNISLSKCKLCIESKRYHILHNAVAHLRRIHFNPRKPKGLEGGSKPREKRGGASGGTDPPSDVLERHWIREIMVDEGSNEKRSSRILPTPYHDTFSPHAPDSLREPLSVDFSVVPTMNPRRANDADQSRKATSAPLPVYNEPHLSPRNTSRKMEPQQELAVDKSIILNEYSDASMKNLIDTGITFDPNDPVLYDISQSDFSGLLDGCNDFNFPFSV